MQADSIRRGKALQKIQKVRKVGESSQKDNQPDGLPGVVPKRNQRGIRRLTQAQDLANG